MAQPKGLRTGLSANQQPTAEILRHSFSMTIVLHFLRTDFTAGNIATNGTGRPVPYEVILHFVYYRFCGGYRYLAERRGRRSLQRVLCSKTSRREHRRSNVRWQIANHTS